MVRFLFITMIALINRFKTWINNPFIKSYTNSIHLHEFPATATQKIFYRIFFHGISLLFRQICNSLTRKYELFLKMHAV